MWEESLRRCATRCRGSWWLLVVVALGLGCPSRGDDDDAADDDDSATVDDDDAVDDDDSGDDDDSASALAGACDQSMRIGGFVVESLPEYSVVQGQVLDGVVPGNVLEPLLAEGGCQLLRRNNPFCDPGCDPGFTCDWDGSCIPYPAALDLGVVTVDGLAAEVSMEPVQPGNNYFAVGLPLELMLAGQEVTLETTGGAWDPIALRGVGVEPLVPADEDWVVEEGEPLALSWTPPTSGAASEVLVSLNINQHGVSPATMFCILPDTGEGEIPASVLDGLFGAGVSGFPTGQLTRRTADSLTNEFGCVDFLARSPRTVGVDVVGYIPCDAMTPCPKGLECNLAIGLCL